jgi:hypothetical protein
MSEEGGLLKLNYFQPTPGAWSIHSGGDFAAGDSV